jgi:copper chaperone CopZ
MSEKTVQIDNISCGHCVRNIQRELGAIAGVERVDGDVARQTVTVAFGPPASWEQIARTLVDIGYPAAAS